MRWLALAAAALALAVGAFALDVYVAAGQTKTLEPHFDGVCTPVRGLHGPEDITIHPRTGVAYVSAANRWAALAGHPEPGSIWAYDLSAPEPELRNLTPDLDPHSLPHGLSLYVGADGRDRLFVVDHPVRSDGTLDHRVLVFDLVDDGLVLVRALRDPLLRSPNDLVAVGPDRFYVTNDHGDAEGLLRVLGDLLRLGTGSVVYYDGERFREVAGGIPYANGINASHDGRSVYVNSANTGILHVFERDPASGDLTPRRTVDLGTGGDNIEVDADGNLWIAAHPKLLDFMAHARDPARRSPSQVLRVSPDGTIEEVYLDLGDGISASSVAAVRGDRLLVGAVFDDHFLDCRMRR